MSKSYPEKLGEWIKLRKVAGPDKNLAGFLIVRDDVKAGLDTGYSVKAVWENMYESQRVTFGYDAFLSYVNRLIRRPHNEAQHAFPVRPGGAGKGKKREPPAGSENQPVETKTPGNAATGFTFNASPRKEDLL
jgi:hypothetical protein